ncbi:hypothetical protein EUX98_g5955 [Antrodiella citrinella]|uniref:Uncharacterized protein n=1 Tax=Antrodiella citrinella TaxID=2447956 RepID=A0A4S4MQJ4_9APHY|nr:hypothetical protein EUX98_g5955 [Antrodiella citrinella]
MTQASQALPSWMTLTSAVITDADGGLSTSFGTLTLPLTYYGPPIPLGTDGTWVYGGLSSPPPVTATSTVPTATSSSPATPSSAPSITSSPTSSPTSSLSPAPPGASATPPATPSHGLSKAAIGGLIGGILGALLLLVLVLTMCVLCRNRRRSGSSGQQTTSSFWNRQTTLFTADPGSTPIWTGWDLVSPTEAEEGIRTPGEGSPRHSGEEQDPFLTRRRSGTIAEEMAQTKTGTDTLVSVPAAAVVSQVRSSPPRTGNIIPRDVINRMLDEGYDEPPTDIRIVEPSPQVDYSPLLPPPMLNPDALGGIGIRTSRNISQRSISSQNRSLGSQKSIGSLEDAELRVARRVRVTELNAESGPSRNNLGLQNLSGRLGRLSWFRRMSLTAAGRAEQADSSADPGGLDAYTRSPTRSSHSRHASRSRPSSYVRFQEEPLSPRTPRIESGLGYNSVSSRPISSVSGKSTSAASGNTVYHDAVSTPTSEIPDVPEIPERFQTRDSNSGNGGSASHSQQSLAQAPGESSRLTGHSMYSTVPTQPPPAYDDNSSSQHRAHTRLPSNIDVLDLPAPAPVTSLATSRFGSGSGNANAFPPPGLSPIPNTWRESYPSNQVSPTSSTDINIDIEDEPPAATAGWRTLAGGSGFSQGGRRTTFGTAGMPMVINPPISPASEQGSLHSMRSHLSPCVRRADEVPYRRYPGELPTSIVTPLPSFIVPSAHRAGCLADFVSNAPPLRSSGWHCQLGNKLDHNDVHNGPYFRRNHACP